MSKKFDVWLKLELNTKARKFKTFYDPESKEEEPIDYNPSTEDMEQFIQENWGQNPMLVVEDQDGTSRKFLKQIEKKVSK